MKISKKFDKGVLLKETTDAATLQGELRVDSADDKLKVYLDGAERKVVTADQAETISNKTIDVDNNTVSNIETDNLKSGVLNTSTTLASASNTQVPSALAVKTYVDDSVAGKDQASEISSVPSGNLAASNVQAALNELQSDIDTRALNSDLTTHTGLSSGVHGVVGSVVGTTDSQTLTNKSLTAATLTGVTKLSDYISEEVANSAVTGTAATLTSPVKPIIRLTDSSLVSLTGISALESAGHGGVLTLINATGNEITILNNAGTASEKILTGTDDDIALASNAALLLKYDVTSDLWRIIGGSGAGGSSVLNYVAGENVSIRDALYISEGAADGARTAGRAYKLDASSEKRIKFVGFAKSTITSGNAVKIVSSGVLKGFSALSAGLPLYLNPASAGGFTQTEPVTTDVWKLKIGLALSATEVLILPDQGLNASFNEIEGSFTIANNQAAAANVTNVAFSSSVTKSFILDYSIFRSSSLESYAQAGRLRGVYNSTTAQWLMSDDYSGQNAGVTFSITSGGQVQYISSNMTGTGYSGSLEYRVSSGDGVAIAGGASGSSGINYVSNPDFIDNANGYTAYKDADQANVVDGTGGSPTGLSIARSTSSPLRGAASGLIAKTSGASRRGEGVSDDFNIDTADQAKMLEISFDYTVTSNYVDGDMRVYIYDVTNAQVIEPSQRDIFANAGQATYRSYFQAASNSVSYRVIWHVATSTTLAYDLKIDNVKVGPVTAGNAGTFVSDWQAYTPIYVGLGTVTGSEVFFRRVGSNLEIYGQVTTGTTTATIASFTLPPGNVVGPTINNSQAVGTYYRVASTAAHGGALIASTLDTTIKFSPSSVFGSAVINPMTQALGNDAFGSAERINFRLDIPIQGWSTGVSASEIPNNSTVAFKARLSANQTLGGSLAKVTFNTITGSVMGCFDKGGGFSTANTRFEAPESGTYVFNFVILANTDLTSGSAYTAQLRKNGTGIKNFRMWANEPTGQYSGNAVIELVKGDFVEVYAAGDASWNAIGGDSADSSIFEGFKLNSPSQIAPTEFVGCYYESDSGNALTSSGYATYEDKIYDTHGLMRAGFQHIDIPISGRYLIQTCGQMVAVSATVGNQVSEYIEKNGSFAVAGLPQIGSWVYQTTTSIQAEWKGTAVIDLVKGDVIRIINTENVTPAISRTTNGYQNYIMVTRIK